VILNVHYEDPTRSVRVGRLADDPASGRIFFQYDRPWAELGLELSPRALPTEDLSVQMHNSPGFRGLHGLFHDSLPDHWGMSLLDARLRKEGHDPDMLSPLVKLSYIGSRAMGALSYLPEVDSDPVHEIVSLAQIDKQASEFLDGERLEGRAEQVLTLIKAGISAGGAKPKVWAAINDQDQIRIGADIPDGYEGWLIKLSNVPIEHKDSKQEGRVEYAYSLMAKASGVHMPQTRIFKIDAPKGKRGLFGVRRFDRIGSKKIHVHSLAGLLQQDFSVMAVTYEDLLGLALELSRDFRVVTEGFRRMIFNIVNANFDDHAKNFSFQMNDKGEWSLAPAFDLNASPGFNNQGHHAMSVNGKRLPDINDIKAIAERFGIRDWRDILSQVLQSSADWLKYAEAAEIRQSMAKRVEERLSGSRTRLNLPLVVAIPAADTV
jgi:serine/threonine-protein kinase HipA